ncbi:ABC transporter ATP-binding protein [Paenibacillus athensensis]|uniref:ABC transporter domain-containing protein n=1 Tax=Paenibacillus athensensis TaxID=1967502 RepID=A0A4Y8PYB4_9BACL|nr:ABC transporter ATP-binding protein [Paenibacillus athensensis]MCD1259696.1 ABC transporter ATP-binding protein [Paenibacillus athensensis]
MSEYAISIKGLCKKLDKLQLGPVDLELEAGYVVALVGPNGSGKSSLLRMLMNMMTPDSGAIQLLGRKLDAEDLGLKQRIGYVPETTEWAQLGFATVEQLRELYAYWYTGWNAQMYERLLSRYELESAQQLDRLSKGMQRKLAFVQALAYDPDMLLLDEPTAGLDPFAWRMMLEDMTAFMERGGKSLLFTTHILDEVRRIADYVVFFYDGKVLGCYEKDALLDGWKTFWTEKPQQAAGLPGVLEIEATDGASVGKVISDAPRATELALQQAGVTVTRTQGMELDEILSYLIRRHKAGTSAVKRPR